MNLRENRTALEGSRPCEPRPAETRALPLFT
jgi:hypothetical protein